LNLLDTPASAREPGPVGAPTERQRPCLIVNPRSFRASRGLAERAIALAEQHGADVLRFETMAALSEGLDGLLARRQQPLMVLAGDGTVHAIVEQLARQPSGAWLPELLLLPGGRSNMTAKDLSPQGDAMTLLARALQRCRERSWTSASRAELSPLCIEQAGSPPRLGFFVGAALVDSVIRATHERREGGTGQLRSGHLSTPWILLRLGVLALFGRSGLACPVLALEASGGERLQGAVRVVLATTLQHAQGLFNPYAERGAGPLRLTAVAHSAPGFWRRLPRILTGRFGPGMGTEQGYLSGRFERVSVTGLSGYALDGEEYDTDPALPVTFSAGPRLRFLLP